MANCGLVPAPQGEWVETDWMDDIDCYPLYETEDAIDNRYLLSKYPIAQPRKDPI